MRFNPTVTEVARNFADFVNRVAFRGERFVLMRGGRPVAELSPVVAGRPLHELADLMASLPRLSPEDAAALAEDVEAAREEAAREPLRSPWES